LRKRGAATTHEKTEKESMKGRSKSKSKGRSKSKGKRAKKN